VSEYSMSRGYNQMAPKNHVHVQNTRDNMKKSKLC
jgi:hypothetical protein